MKGLHVYYILFALLPFVVQYQATTSRSRPNNTTATENIYLHYITLHPDVILLDYTMILLNSPFNQSFFLPCLCHIPRLQKTLQLFQCH